MPRCLEFIRRGGYLGNVVGQSKLAAADPGKYTHVPGGGKVRTCKSPLADLQLDTEQRVLNVSLILTLGHLEL